MDTAIPKVSIREFRSHLAQYSGANSTIAITRHSETLGYYIPIRPSPDKAAINVLKEVASRLDAFVD